MIKILFFRFLLLFFVLFAIVGFSRGKEPLKLATDNFDDGNYKVALYEYLELLKDNPLDKNLNYKIGICYLNTNINKAKAIPYLETLIPAENNNPIIYYLLGRAYHYGYRFRDAITMYEKFKIANKNAPENLKDVGKQIEYAYNAIEIMKFPLDVTFTNMGANINTDQLDYNPFVPFNESFLVYNSKQTLVDEVNYTDIYLSKAKHGKYEQAKKIAENLNSFNGSKEVVGISASGNKILLHLKNGANEGNIFIADYVDEKIENVTKLPKEINSKNHEISATIDKTGSIIYFSSDKEGGFGGVDIYSSKKLPNGKWGPPQNLGPTINTSNDENFPNIAADNKTLYFSSKGHTSMGGYDIFKASWSSSKKKWGDINNIGYPINTPEDNTNFIIHKNSRTAYISALRENGIGDLDIYKVTFNGVDPKYTVLKGYVCTSESEQIKNVLISVLNKETDELYGNYTANPETGKYIIILPPGKYNALIEAKGFENLSEDIEVLGKNSFRSLIKKNYTLNPIGL